MRLLFILLLCLLTSSVQAQTTAIFGSGVDTTDASGRVGFRTTGSTTYNADAWTYETLADGDTAMVKLTEEASGGHTWLGNAGLMVAPAAAATGRMAALKANRVNYLWAHHRATDGGDTIWERFAVIDYPRWLRARYAGTSVYLEHSGDSTSWAALDTVDVSSWGQVLAGRLAQAYDDERDLTIFFDLVTVLSGGGGGDLVCNDPTWATATAVSGATAATTTVSSDLDGDGDDDLVVLEGGKGSGGTQILDWFEWNGAGFTEHAINDTWLSGLDAKYNFFGSAELYDMDGDGDPDLVFSIDMHTSGTDGKLMFAENPGGTAEGTWTVSELADLTGELQHMNDMVVADFDGDGLEDIAGRHLDPTEVIIFFQDTFPGSWTVRKIGVDENEGMEAGDLTGDGKPEIILNGFYLTNPADSRADAWPRTNYESAFYTQSGGQWDNATKEVLAGLDGDGDLGIIQTGAESTASLFAWYENDGSGGLTKRAIEDPWETMHGVHAGDFDGDGDLDLGGGQSFGLTGIYVWYFEDGAYTGTRQTVNASRGLYTGSAGDFDGDGDLDIAGPTAYTGQVYFYRATTDCSGDDVAAPAISSFDAANPSGQDVRVSFNSDEQLADIEVAITGAETATLTEADFAETGNYTYTATYAGSSDGTYTATLNTAEDATGNDGASGQSDNVVVSTPSGDPTFATTLNPTGDPIGGGPGYTGAWRTSEGYSGQGIYTEADADHVITTETELRSVALSYYDRSTGTTENGGSPATNGQVVFLKGDAERVLLVNNTLELDFNAGVTVASDLGYANGDGTYEWGTRVRVEEPWDNYQVQALFAPSGAWRLTGMILEGHSAWGGKANANDTDQWQGGSLGVRSTTGYGAEFELDNVWLFGFNYTAIMMYRGPALAHHVRVAWSRWEGYGYGLWPGRDPGQADGTEYDQRLIGWIIEETRHSTDHIHVGISDNGDGTYTSSHESRVSILNGILEGASRSTRLNTHGRPHHVTISHVAETSKRTILARDPIIQQGGPSAAPGGGVFIDHIWSQYDEQTAGEMIQVGGFNAHEWESGTAISTADEGPVEIDYASIFSGGSGQVLPDVTATMSETEITAGQTADLILSASDADGHAIRYYEVRWGDRTDVRKATEFYSPSETPSRTYPNPGVYRIKVLAYNEHGVRGEKNITVTVDPASSEPHLSFARAPDVSGVTSPEGGGADWSGYYEVRFLLNGTVVSTYDWGAPSEHGWRWEAVDVSSILDSDNTLQFRIEVETLQNIADPGVSEPAMGTGYWTNLWLHGVPGILAAGGWVSEVDPLFTDVRQHFVPNDWEASGSTGRVDVWDTPSDIGQILYRAGGSTTQGALSSWDSPAFDYLHPVRNLATSRAGGNLTATWDVQTLADRVNVRFYRVSDDALLHEALDAADDGSYTWADASGDPCYVEVEAVAQKWDDAGADVTTRPAIASE